MNNTGFLSESVSLCNDSRALKGLLQTQRPLAFLEHEGECWITAKVTHTHLHHLH